MACMHCLLLNLFEADSGDPAAFIEGVARGLAQISALSADDGHEKDLLKTITDIVTEEFERARVVVDETRATHEAKH